MMIRFSFVPFYKIINLTTSVVYFNDG